MKNKGIWLLFGIIFLAIVLRFWGLGKIPIAPDWDEAALGYNAYSLISTGRDEYGELLPIVLRSFDDYKPALYAYFAIPSVLLFDLTTFAVRFPSAFFGLISVIAIYFLVKELFKKDSIALLSSLLLAISPWHIQFSRIAFESNVGLALNILAFLAFLKGLKKPWFLVPAAFLAGINIYMYQSEKVFTPLLLIASLIIFSKELLKIPKKYLIFAVIVGLVVVTPMSIYTLTNKEALGRARGVSVFSQSSELLKENSQRLLEDKKNNDALGFVLDNRRIEFAKSVISGYISHFNLNWLFINGDIARHHAPNMGLMYLFELPFLFLGIYYLFFGNFGKKTKLLIFSWFLIAPIPASITSGVPHAVRTLNFLPIFQIFTALGIFWFIEVISRNNRQFIGIKIKYFLFSILISLALFNFIYYLNQYFVQQNYFNAKEWQYGYEEIIPKIKDIEGDYDKIIISNEAPMDQSYMFFLFYLKYPPDEYQNESIGASGGFKETHRFGKYEFRPIDWSKEIRDGKTLFVGRPADFSGDINAISKVDYPNGEKAILIVR